MPISDETLDEIERLLAASVASFDSANPMRQADMHRASCVCLRCRRDQQEATLDRLRAERKEK